MKIPCSKPLLITALVHWLITFATDRIFFEYSLFTMDTTKDKILSLYAWGIKAVFLVLLVVGYQMLQNVVKRLKSNEKSMREYLYYAGIYFLLMLLLLFSV